MVTFVADYLDLVMYCIVASGILLGFMMLRVPYKASANTIDETRKSSSRGLAIGIGLNGFFIFIAGLMIIQGWQLRVAGTGLERFVPGLDVGVYNVLYGGPMTLAGLVLMGVSLALFTNGSLSGLKEISYFGVVEGLYLIVGAYSDWAYPLVAPNVIVPLFLSIAATTFLAVPATHFDNKWMRRMFAVFAFLFAAAWAYTAATTTFGHVNPKGPSN